jgi:hypothetical protein
MQTPASHASVCVQRLPSLHDVPSDLAGFEQMPVAGSQVPAVWHWSWALQTTAFAPVHVPFWQVSVWVQVFSSLHAVPSALAGFEQTPVAGSHVPAAWHWSWALQVRAFEPAHVPFWQTSV